MPITATASTSDKTDTGQASSSLHLTSVDALRGIAAIYVACFHVAMVPSPHLAMPEWIRPFMVSGSAGVAMFFVVSAFTLSISWFSRKDGAHPFRNFYFRRVFRIVPLFYFLLAITIPRDFYRWHVTHPAKDVLLNLSLLFNLVPGKSIGIVWASWTIGVEVLFYLMFPLVIRAGSTSIRLASCFIGALLTAVIFYQVVQFSSLSPALKAEYFPTGLALHVPVFILGMITYTIYVSGPFRRIRAKWFAILLVVAGIGLHLVLAYNRMYLGIVGTDWSAPAWALLVLGLVVCPVKPVVNAITRFYGQISYSVYLNHPFVIAFLMPVYPRIYRHISWNGLALLACFAATFAVLTPWAYCTYRLIEQPGIRLGSRLIKSLNRNDAVFNNSISVDARASASPLNPGNG
jgi:peptidoglycan/LPS O-acetylase OafA/YrhL